MNFELETQKLSRNGITISKGLCFFIIFAIMLAFVGLILGLTLGLKKKECDQSDEQKYETCVELSCRNSSILLSLNNECSSRTSTSATTQKPNVKKNYRLPKNLKPYNYEITIATQFDANTEPDTFDGVVKIFFTCLQKTNHIVLHQHNLDIIEALIIVKQLSDNTNINVTSWTYDNQTDLLDLELSKNLEKDRNYSLSIHYQGYFKSNNVGFYKSFYTGIDGKKRWLISSQMEATDARKAFPCFDEPEMKATFKISVIHNNNLTAISNMPGNITNLSNNLTKTDFDTSIIMTTYLVALVISDFHCLNQTIENIGEYGKVDVRVCSRPDAVANGYLNYSLQTTVKIIKDLENFYGVKYSLPKCDSVALPDFSFGAMENWGLIIYREAILFYDPKTNSNADKQRTVVVIAHELAHMWFGNLVTLKWWNDIWLNEGFATYIEYVGADFADKSFLMYEQFVQRIFTTFEIDSVRNSRAISMNEEDVNDPDKILGLFDQIAYGKGGSLIRMLNYIISAATFNKGIKNYLEKYKFSNTRREDLWVELEKAANEDSKLSNLNLTEVMNTWTLQMGHPLITIEIVNENSIKISQKQFLIDPSSPPVEKSEYNYKYYIPFTYSHVEKVGASSNDAFNVGMDNLYNRIEWLKQNEDSKIIQLKKPLSSDGFILGNLDVSGFYRINYDNQSWNNIVKQLTDNKDAIPTRIRAQLINDAFDLSKAGHIVATRPFEIIKFLSKESEYLPWSTTLTKLTYFSNLLDTTAIFGKYGNYLTNLIRPLYNRLGWIESESNNWLDKLLRRDVLSFACENDLDDCVHRAQYWMNHWMHDEKNNSIPGNYRNFIYCTAMRNGGEKEWEFLSNQYEKEQNAIQLRNLQQGMACAKQPWLVTRYLNDQINSTKVRLQDTAYGISYISEKSYGNTRAWTFIKDNWDYLVDKILMERVIPNIASKFNTLSQLDDFERFFENRQNQGSATREIKSSIDKIKANIRWLNSAYSLLNDWFSKNA